MWEAYNLERIICQFLGTVMESHYVEQAKDRWECFERAEAASSVDSSGTRLAALIFCSRVFKVVFHHSEAMPFTAFLHIPVKQIRPFCFQMSKILCFQATGRIFKDFFEEGFLSHLEGFAF